MNADDDTGGSVATATGVTYAAGKHGDAFLLDGSDDVSIDDNDMLWPAGSFSVEAWINTFTDAATIISKYQCGGLCPAGTATAQWLLELGDGKVSFSVRSDAATASAGPDGNTVVADGQWHHVVGVLDAPNATATLYIDGAVDATVAVPANETTGMSNTDGEVDPILIGAIYTGGTTTIVDHFVGEIDEVAFYDAALTPEQIAAIYAAPDGECN